MKETFTIKMQLLKGCNEFKEKCISFAKTPFVFFSERKLDDFIDSEIVLELQEFRVFYDVNIAEQGNRIIKLYTLEDKWIGTFKMKLIHWV